MTYSSLSFTVSPHTSYTDRKKWFNFLTFDAPIHPLFSPLLQLYSMPSFHWWSSSNAISRAHIKHTPFKVHFQLLMVMNNEHIFALITIVARWLGVILSIKKKHIEKKNCKNYLHSSSEIIWFDYIFGCETTNNDEDDDDAQCINTHTHTFPLQITCNSLGKT